MIKADVCVMVVTFNRCDYLGKLLDALCGQTIKPSIIVIFDNHSSDNTQDLLACRGFVTRPLGDGECSVCESNGMEIHCLRNAVNSGGAGGFHDGIRYARSLNPRYIWAMDDDVFPAPDCLEILLSGMTLERKICLPNRTTGDDYIDGAITRVNMSNPFLYSIGLRKMIVPSTKLSEEVTPVQDMPFEGPLMDSTLIDEIGLPNKDLFITFDDSEYCTRALRHTTVGFVRSAHLYKQIIPRTDHARLMGWKDYYGYRNQYWFDRTYGENAAVRVLRPFLSRLDLTLRAIARRKWTNVRVISRAYDDGTHGRLGKLVEPGGNV